MGFPPDEIVWGPEAYPLCLGVQTEKSVYSLGERSILLRLFLANRSPRAIEVVETNVLADYTLEVLRSDGRIVLWSPQGIQALQAAAEITRRLTVRIDPGAVRRVGPDVHLDEWFQLDTPGTYSVRAQRTRQAGSLTLSSGLIHFRIEEQPP